MLKGPVVCQERLSVLLAMQKGTLCVWLRPEGHMTNCWYLTTWDVNMWVIAILLSCLEKSCLTHMLCYSRHRC